MAVLVRFRLRRFATLAAAWPFLGADVLSPTPGVRASEQQQDPTTSSSTSKPRSCGCGCGKNIFLMRAACGGDNLDLMKSIEDQLAKPFEHFGHLVVAVWTGERDLFDEFVTAVSTTVRRNVELSLQKYKWQLPGGPLPLGDGDQATKSTKCGVFTGTTTGRGEPLPLVYTARGQLRLAGKLYEKQMKEDEPVVQLEQQLLLQTASYCADWSFWETLRRNDWTIMREFLPDEIEAAPGRTSDGCALHQQLQSTMDARHFGVVAAGLLQHVVAAPAKFNELIDRVLPQGTSTPLNSKIREAARVGPKGKEYVLAVLFVLEMENQKHYHDGDPPSVSAADHTRAVRAFLVRREWASFDDAGGGSAHLTPRVTCGRTAGGPLLELKKCNTQETPSASAAMEE